MTKESARVERLLRLPPLLRGGLRPFFLGGAIWAMGVVGMWTAAYNGWIVIPSRFDGLAWHRHEMLFGYLAAVICGFLMTAIPNWTGRFPVSGRPLAAFVALWLAARLAVLFSGVVGFVPAFGLDVGFLLVLTLFAAREIFAARNRNVPIVVVLALLTLASALDYAELAGLGVPAGLGWRRGFAMVLLLVGLIGGRIIPSFTRNWLMKTRPGGRMPFLPNRFDQASLAAMAIALASWAAMPLSVVTAALLGLAALLQAVRLSRWCGLSTRAEPIVFVLHIAYAWLPLGLALLTASHFVAAIPASAALHALSAGAIASMTLAVMTRASLGHTGRALIATPATLAIYTLVTLGAVLRVGAYYLPLDYALALDLAAAVWGAAFAMFVIAYIPLLARPRPDGRP
jgi:uncharacterized protein involved in response to NO